MSSEDRLILDYMAILRHLSTDLKLRLISKLTDSIRESDTEKRGQEDDSWKALFGVWSDTDEDLADIIRDSRLPNRETASFDE